MKNKLSRYLICLMYLITPLYFNNTLGFSIPYLITPFIFLILYKKISDSNFLVFFLIIYTLLFIIQFLFIENIEIIYFIKKYFSIFAFLIIFSASKLYYNKSYDKFIINSFILTFIYGLYSSFSYIVGYQDYLIPGTCESNNLSQFNHLRCSTFGEGNYYGNYIALFAILYADKKKISIFALMASLIAFSPIPFIITFYITFYKNKNFLILSLFLLLIIIYFNSDEILSAFYSQTSSLGERIEFIRAALKMGFNNFWIGVGMGQYGVVLPQYTDYPHFIEADVNSIRYIPNNNLAELFSEQGLIGLFFYIIYLLKFYHGRIGQLSRNTVILFILLIGFAMPTLYLIFVAILTGAISAKLKSNS